MTVLAAPPPTTGRPTIRGRRGLWAGVIAGPLFVTTAGGQILVRDGFDLTRHPISLLANGPFGWVQSANFIVAGLLVTLFAYALTPQLRSQAWTGGPRGVVPPLRGSRGAEAVPVLFALFGVGLVVGGVFKAQPAMGFPAGAPAGYPAELATASIIHAFAPPLSFLALVAGCLVLARRFATEGDRAAAVVTVVVAAAGFLLPLPFGPLHSVRLFVAVVIGFTWLTCFALRIRRTR